MADTINEYKRLEFFYDEQVLKHPEMPAILDCASKLSAMFRVQSEWEVFSSLVQIRPDGKILELGCGAGRWVEKFAPLSRKVTGVDFSANALRIARSNAAQKGLTNVKYFHGKIQDFEPEDYYDFIYFGSVLLHIDDSDLDYCIEKYSRYLTPEGFFVIRDTLAKVTHRWNDSTGYLAFYRSVEDLKSHFENHGFFLTKRQKAQRNLRLLRIWNSRILNKRSSLLSNKNIFPKLYFVMKKLSGLLNYLDPYPWPFLTHDFLLFEKVRK